MTGAAAAIIAFLAEIERRRSDTRSIIAVAGPPGSGKTTFAASLETRLNRDSPDLARILPMDGFHYDDAVLRARGRLARKGAPDTFDIGGLTRMLMRLRENTEPEVAVPVFDRDLEISRAAARIVPQAVQNIIVEGNYLLVADPPWQAMHALFDVTVFIDTPEPVLRERLTRRWQHYDLPPDEIRRKLEENDLPNARYVSQHSATAEFRFHDSAWAEGLRAIE